MFCQFIKGALFSGEVAALERFAPLVEVRRYGPECSRGQSQPTVSECGECRDCWLNDDTRARHAQLASRGLVDAARALRTGEHDLVVLDELCLALSENLLNAKETEAYLQRAQCTEVIVTGRSVPDWLVEMADVVSEISCVKYSKDSSPRAGIEY